MSNTVATIAVCVSIFVLAVAGIYLMAAVVTSPEYYAKMAAERVAEVAAIGVQFPQLSEKQCQQIADGDVWLGMTDEMARKSWGRTNVVNTSVNQWGTREQWVYRSDYSTKYLYFQNGILASYSF